MCAYTLMFGSGHYLDSIQLCLFYMYMYMCVYIHVGMYKCGHVCESFNTNKYIHIHTYMRMYIQTYIQENET